MRAALFFALLVVNVYYLGRLLLHALPLDGSLARSFALIFLTGSLSWALLRLALHSLLPGSLPWHMQIPAEIVRRCVLLEHFKTVTTAEQIQEVAAQTGIRWYLLHPEDRVAWPREFLAQPVFRCQGFAVYDLRRAANENISLAKH